jgi:hypothetical protein
VLNISLSKMLGNALLVPAGRVDCEPAPPSRYFRDIPGYLGLGIESCTSLQGFAILTWVKFSHRHLLVDLRPLRTKVRESRMKASASILIAMYAGTRSVASAYNIAAKPGD